mmetsp:Transcript_18772/g.24784  ORF Transcript_18772/g.24784 Transcript_18772/m.24784 type:complete len:234 (+) Transcript_18772:71-772(+)|eukprot:CAMPEP_0117749018 /NCGR_PEP_ID=MMETSP0947-20121206/9492_1 /TAXON_ID=44440 /ORGANISM="Chattonella subsalsa, Strain CCMP2191" /LENGTH=233 /DNA_ID=CAMNT_0005566853 /DNA_START=22 /DNA_END=723 /DNA_ORIENTATION=-
MAGSDSLRNYAVLGQNEDLKALLSGGGNPHATDDCGLNALHYAVWNGHVQCVKTLLANDMGVDENGVSKSCLDSQTSLGLTPLHIAALEGIEGPKIVQLLLLAGADPTIKNVDGHTAEDLARQEERLDCLEIFMQKPHENEAEVHQFKQEMEQLVVRKRITQRQGKRAPAIPKELNMDEELIRPFANENNEAARSAQVIRNLLEAREQSQKNETRRENLAFSVENDLKAKGLI